MKLKAEQLHSHLQSALKPAYWLSGDEPLQLRDSADAIRQAARAQGFNDREVYDVDKQFDWNHLQNSSSNLSLFSDRKLIELRMRSSKLDESARKSLLAYLAQTNSDTVMLMTSPRIESAATKTQWFSQLEKQIVVLQFYPVDLQHLPAWLNGRLQHRGMTADPDALELLAERVEGNMLAADQELEKLALLFGAGAHIDVRCVTRSVADNARFNVFGLIDTCLAGHTARALKTLARLREEGAETLMLNSLLARELRQLHNMACQVHDKGQAPSLVLKTFRVWGNRQQAVTATLRRTKPATIRNLLKLSHSIDLAVKGAGQEDAWLLLERLCARLAGSDLRLDTENKL